MKSGWSIAPCQHNCARGAFDKDKSLWASWTIQSLGEEGKVGHSVSVPGSLGIIPSNDDRYGLVEIPVRQKTEGLESCDTHRRVIGYSAVYGETHTLDPSLPVCPAFAEIGRRLGPFSLGLIPIGAYAPRVLFSIVHNAPIDAVRMFKDLVGGHA